MDKLWMGAQLRRIRTLAGVSLEDAAERTGVSRPALSSWELGLALPSPDKLARLATVYGMAPEELAAYVDYPIKASVVRTLRQWYDDLRAAAVHSSGGGTGHTKAQRPRDDETHATDGGHPGGVWLGAPHRLTATGRP